MKVISGLYKGRTILGYNIEGTRPTQDRVKESIFSTIQSHLKDAIVLDLFAGSGNLGIEALSNYSEYAYFVDFNKQCCSIINKNISNLNIDNYKVLNMDYKKALEYFKINNIKFDIIFLDPPYKYNIIQEVLIFISNNNLLNSEGIIVCEAEIIDFNNEYNNLELIKEKKYGYKYVYIYKRY